MLETVSSSQPIPEVVKPVAADTTKPSTKHVSKRDEQLPQLQNVVLKTHHYNPSAELADYLAYFATLHRFDDRVTYKEAWTEWIQSGEIASLLEDEVERLQLSGYTGNALDKIYKSARYYYRKKPLSNNADQTGDGAVAKKKRKKYEGLPTSVLDAMDLHIAQCIKAHIVTITQSDVDGLVMKSSVAPNEAYTQYVEGLVEPLSDEMEKKYKKTYKNRFFLYRNKLHK